MILQISFRKVARLLTGFALCLSLAGVVSEFILSSLAPGNYRGLAELLRRFLLNDELTIPAWYSSVALLACAGLLGIISYAKRQTASPYFIHWAVLAALFVFLSIDEMTALHEMLIDPIRRRLGTHGLLYYAWVIPGFAFVCGFVLAYWRFLFFHLDRKTRWRFVLAGSIFVTGALGLEMVEGAIHEQFGIHDARYQACVTVEETFEMFGVVLFMYSLMAYIASSLGEVHIRFVDEAREKSVSGTRLESGWDPDAQELAAALHGEGLEIDPQALPARNDPHQSRT